MIVPVSEKLYEEIRGAFDSKVKVKVKEVDLYSAFIEVPTNTNTK